MAKPLAEIKSMTRQQLDRMKREDLVASIMADQYAGVSSMTNIELQLQNLTQEMALMRQEANSRETINSNKIKAMEATINKQSEILTKQQMYLESVDRKKREKNLIILGVPENNTNLDGCSGDEAKITNIWEKIDETCTRISHKRLGKEDQDKIRDGKVRPILIVVDSKETRDTVLEKAKALSTKGENYKKIYIKKDIHPEVRKEWDRLRAAETREKADPNNVGATIRLDTRERKLYRNDTVIDSWTPHPF